MLGCTHRDEPLLGAESCRAVLSLFGGGWRKASAAASQGVLGSPSLPAAGSLPQLHPPGSPVPSQPHPINPLSCHPILSSSHPLIIPWSRHPIIASSHQPIIPSSHLPNLPSSHHPILPWSHQPIIPSSRHPISPLSHQLIIPSSHPLIFPLSHHPIIPWSRQPVVPSSHHLINPSHLIAPSSHGLMAPSPHHPIITQEGPSSPKPSLTTPRCSENILLTGLL